MAEQGRKASEADNEDGKHLVLCGICIGFPAAGVVSLQAIAASNDGLPKIKQKNGPPTLPVIPVIGHRYPEINWGLFNDLHDWNAPTFQSVHGFEGIGHYHSPNNHTATTDKKKDKAGCQGSVSDPVEVDDGAKVLSVPLFKMPGEMGLSYALYYHSVTSSSFWASNPWKSSISYVLDLFCGVTSPGYPCSKVTLYRPDGSSISFSGNQASYGNFPEIGGGGLATLVHNSDGTWTLHDEDATIQTYGKYDGNLTSIKDAAGVGWTISSTVTTSVDGAPGMPGTAIGGGCPAPRGILRPMCAPPNPPGNTHTSTTTTVVTHTDGQSFTIVTVVHNAGTTYTSGSVTVTDPAGNQYTYSLSYYPIGSGLDAVDVATLTFPGSPATTMTFSYTGSNQLFSGVAYNGAAYWSTSYDSSNRVSEDGAADGTEQTSITYATSSGGLVATITNPLGLTTKNTYTTDAQGNYLLAKVSNSAVLGCGSTTNSMAWDSNDNLTKTVDNDGITHTYDYAANGQLQTETEAAGTAVARIINYTWDPDAQLNRMLSTTIPGESKVSYTYSVKNRVASVTRSNLTGIGTPNQALTSTYAYTLYVTGMVETMTVTAPSPSGTDKTTYAYDTHGNLTSVTDGLGHVTSYSNYNALGEVGKTVGPNGDETDYTYDARGRVASKTTHPNGTTATWTYAYDGFGLLASVSAPDNEVTSWSRDAEKRVKTITHNDKDGTSTETYAYDATGNVISDVIARGSDIGKSTSYVYNALGEIYQVKGSHGQVLTYAYDGNGNVLSVTDALGHKTSHAYDALNRVVTVTNAANGVMRYAYDRGNHVVKVTDPRGLVTTYTHDGLGLLWKQVSPDTGTTSFSYDAYGRLAHNSRADGVTQSYSYDALNRLTKVTAGGQSRTFTWDGCTNGKGRLCTAATSTSSVDYTYTPEGWVAARGFSFPNGTTYVLGFSYGAMGQLSAVTYPDGNQALYDYSHGVVYQVRMKIGSSTHYAVAEATYRPMDLAMTTWKSYSGVVNTIAYDSDLRPTSITASGAESLAFSYDAADRITHIGNGLDSSMTESLGYDALNRLNSVSSSAQTASYNYDADGNRTYQKVNGTATSFAYAAGSNRLASASGALAASYGYNGDGDTVTVDGHSVYTYDPFDRLQNASGTDFEVSAEGQRLRKQTGGNTDYYAPGPAGTLLAQTQYNSWSDYVWLNGRVVARTRNGYLYPIYADQTGRPLVLTNYSKTVDWATKGYPFERKLSVGGHVANVDVGFPGQSWDGEDGLWHNGARDYDATLGRYIESDPIGLAGGINTYAYTLNNPISNVDPSGLGTIALGVQYSANAIIKFDISLQFSISWNPAQLTSPSQWKLGDILSVTPFTAASTSVGSAIGVLGTYSEANDPSDLDGWGGTFGVSGGVGPVAGFDLGNVGPCHQKTYNVFGGLGFESVVGAGVPLEGHAGVSWTTAGGFSL